MPDHANALTVNLNRHILTETRKSYLTNVGINAGIGYLAFYGVTEVHAWGEGGYGKDVLLTAFLLPAIVSCITIVTHRRKRGDGKFPRTSDGPAILRQIPYRPWLAALVFGIAGVVLAAPLLLGLLMLLDMTTLTPLCYALIKGGWAGLLVAFLVPCAIRQGLRPDVTVSVSA